MNDDERATYRSQRPSGSADELWRTPGERDMDRILYASAYRRLGGVTQVLPAGEQPLMHNRLTHSLKVQQVAKREAQFLQHHTDPELIERAGGLDPAVAEAAGAAHDLGHPPFGHVAEDELQVILNTKLAKATGDQPAPDSAAGRASATTTGVAATNTGAPAENSSTSAAPVGVLLLPDSFEGNAQTFRIVTKLSVRKQGTAPGQVDRLGLDLTYATQAAILKYPWQRGMHATRGTPVHADSYYRRKWGAYSTEGSALEAALRCVPDGQVRSLEAEIMDYADDVTYAVHDIEDFFRLGLIPLHELAVEGVRDSFAALTRDRPGPAFSSFWSFAQAEIEAKGEIEFNSEIARRMFSRVASLFPGRPFQDDERDRLDLHWFISSTVSVLQEGTRISANGQFHVPEETRMLIEVLKQMTWYFVIEHPTLAALQIGQRKVIQDLVKWCLEWAEEYDPDKAGTDHAKRQKINRRRERELPGRLRSYLAAGMADKVNLQDPPSDEAIRLRAVVDFVSSLTEAEAYDLHRRLGGKDPNGLMPLGFMR